jgi:hypothetical protein
MLTLSILEVKCSSPPRNFPYTSYILILFFLTFPPLSFFLSDFSLEHQNRKQNLSFILQRNSSSSTVLERHRQTYFDKMAGAV